jgi:hypothetical protein
LFERRDRHISHLDLQIERSGDSHTFNPRTPENSSLAARSYATRWYVAPWRTPAPSVIWNAHGFTGAELAWAELAIDEDPRAAALDFWRAARAALAS